MATTTLVLGAAVACLPMPTSMSLINIPMDTNANFNLPGAAGYVYDIWGGFLKATGTGNITFASGATAIIGPLQLSTTQPIDWDHPWGNHWDDKRSPFMSTNPGDDLNLNTTAGIGIGGFLFVCKRQANLVF